LHFRSLLSDEKRRLDSRISELEEELEEERAQNEMLEEKAKRSQLAVNFCFYSFIIYYLSARRLRLHLGSVDCNTNGRLILFCTDMFTDQIKYAVLI
jgi:hypothetical protein